MDRDLDQLINGLRGDIAYLRIWAALWSLVSERDTCGIENLLVMILGVGQIKQCNKRDIDPSDEEAKPRQAWACWYDLC